MAAAICAGSVPVWAGINEWTSIGPEGGTIRLLVNDPHNPNTVFAASPGGFFKSTNGGVSWRAVGSGLPTGFVLALVVDSQTPNTLYAGARDGVFKSTDGGANWEARNSGLPVGNGRYTDIPFLAIDPENPSTIFAAVSWGDPVGNGGYYGHTGVFKSTDGGTNWSALGSAPGGLFIYISF